MADVSGMVGADTSIYNNKLFQPQQTQAQDPLDRMNAVLGLQNKLVQNQSAQIDLANKKLGTMRETLTSLLADPNLDLGKVTNAVTGMVSNGLLDKDMATRELANMPSDTAGIQQKLKEHLFNNISAQQRLEAVYGTPMVNNTGQTTNIGTMAPAMGGYKPNVALQNEIPPVPAASPVAGPPGPNGEPTTETLASQAARRGVPAGVIPRAGMPGNALSPAPVQPANRLGATSPTGAPPVMPAPVQPAPAAAKPATPYGSLVGPEAVGLPPGQAQGAEVAGAEAGKAFSSDITHAANISQRTFPLIQAIQASEKLGKTGTGPGTDQLNNIKSFLQSAGVPGIDAEKIKNFDEAKKYFTDYVNRNGNTGTNDKLAAAFAGSPGVGISNAAAVDVAKSAVAIDRMRAAQARAFAATGLPQSQYSTWAANWNANQDVRAYGADLMGPVKVRQLTSGMSEKELPRFLKSLETAHQLQLTSPRSGQ